MDKYARFNVTDATYKTVEDQNIDLTILTPKDLPQGKKHAVMLRFHGGYLVTGARLTASYWPNWYARFQKISPVIMAIFQDKNLCPSQP